MDAGLLQAFRVVSGDLSPLDVLRLRVVTMEACNLILIGDLAAVLLALTRLLSHELGGESLTIWKNAWRACAAAAQLELAWRWRHSNFSPSPLQCPHVHP